MYLYKTAHFKSVKGETTGEALRRLQNALRDAGYENLHVNFCLDDMEVSKISACERGIKRFPELKAFECRFRAIGYIGEDKWKRALHNFDARWEIPLSPNPGGEVAWSTLSEIADGIPKAFPFWTATFLVELPDWLEQQQIAFFNTTRKRASLDLAAYFIPHVCLQSSWAPTRRQIHLSAMIPVQLPPEDTRKLPGLPSQIQSVINSLGRLNSSSLSLMRSGQEAASDNALREKADGIIVQFRGENAFSLSSDVYERLKLPHDLPSVREVGICGEYGSGTTREVLNEVFRPRGFRSLRKTTSRNNRITLSVDTGSFIRSATFHLSIQGFDWYYVMGLGVSRRAANDNQYPIQSQDQWRMICENVGVVVDFVEQNIFAPVEQVYPPTPKWYEFTR